MNKVRQFLGGKKTYIVAAAGFLTALGAWSDGSLSTRDLIIAFFGALATATLRAGIGKAE